MENLFDRWSYRVILCSMLASPSTGWSTETDNFRRFSKTMNLPDAAPILEHRINSAIAETAREASRQGLPCNEDGKQNFFDLMLPKVACPEPIGRSPLEAWAIDDSAVAKLDSPFRGSIYDGSQSVDKRVRTLSPQIKLAGIPVGTDKLGHFIKQGSLYYQELSPRGTYRNVAEVVRNVGVAGEESLYGIGSTGVKSYGDLAANFQGMRFWHNLLHGKNPHVACSHGQFRLVRPFQFKDYVNWAWNEAINCSEFDPIMGGNFRESGKHCPIKLELCQQIVRMRDAQYFVSPQCMYAAQHPGDRGGGPGNQFRPTINPSMASKLKSKAVSFVVNNLLSETTLNSEARNDPEMGFIEARSPHVSRQAQDRRISPATVEMAPPHPGFAPSPDLATIPPVDHRGPGGGPRYRYIFRNSQGADVTFIGVYAGPLFTCGNIDMPMPGGGYATLPRRMLVPEKNMVRITQCPRY